MNDFKRVYPTEHARQIADWLKNRGGIAIWRTLNLSDPGKSWTTPADSSRPDRYAESLPSEVITDPNDVGVTQYREHKRFHVALRMGKQGFALKLTDASNNRLNRALQKAGAGSSYEFDYETQEAVILVPDKVEPINTLPVWDEV